MKCHLTSLFPGVFRKDDSLTIKKTNQAYDYFMTEYPHEVDIRHNGDLIIRNEKVRQIKEYIGRFIKVGSDSYTYFVNEYRQNSPVRDNDGNIILSDDIAMSPKK